MPLSASAPIWTERRAPETGRRSLPVIGSRVNTYFYIDTGPGASEIRTRSDFRKTAARLLFESAIQTHVIGTNHEDLKDLKETLPDAKKAKTSALLRSSRGPTFLSARYRNVTLTV
jgi:hypothetical protein